MRGRRLIDPVVLAAFGCIIALLFIGSIYSANFLSPD
jgi:ribose transport system permease protein